MDNAETSRVVHALRVINDATDHELRMRIEQAAADGQPVTCKRGCAHCCRQLVTCTVAEAIGILLHLRHAARLGDDVRDRLFEDVELLFEAGMSNEKWFKLQRPCVLLKDEQCTVYQVRPTSCRALMVVSEPERCNVANGSVQVLALDTREVVHESSGYDMQLSAHSGVPRGQHPLQVALMLAMKAMVVGVPAAREQMLRLGINPDFPEMFWSRLELSPSGKTYSQHDADTNKCHICHALTPAAEWHDETCPHCGADHAEMARMMSAVVAHG